MKLSKSIVIIVICLTVAMVLLIRECTRESRRTARIKKGAGQYWYCEQCRKEFLAPMGDKATCPKCKETVTIQRSKRRCKSCNTEFVAYDWDMSNGQIRPLGGDWQSAGDALEIRCPKCSSSGEEHIILPEKK